MDGKYRNKQEVYIEFLNKWIVDFKRQLEDRKSVV